MAFVSGLCRAAYAGRARSLSTTGLAAAKNHRVLIFEGDGISPEIVGAARTVVDGAARASGGKWQIDWREMDGFGCEVRGIEQSIEERHLHAFEETKVLLKGSVSIPNGGGYVELRGKRFTSPNQVLRKLFHLYGNVRPARSVRIGGVPGRFDDAEIDLLVVRENTEDLYQSAVPEKWVDDDTVDATKRITRGASRRIAEYAFRLAQERRSRRCQSVKHSGNGTAKVTAVHKASVIKQADGLFLHEARAVSKSPLGADILYEEALVDSICAGLVMHPGAYDVLVMPNTWGDIISDLAGGIVGSLGLLGSSNIGPDHALFEPSHGSAPDIAGRGVANPASMILSAAMMLRHLGEFSGADAVESALLATFADGCATPDVGGCATTSEVVEEVLLRLESLPKKRSSRRRRLAVNHDSGLRRCSLSVPGTWDDVWETGVEQR